MKLYKVLLILCLKENIDLNKGGFIMARLTLPYDITKIFEVKKDEITGKEVVDITKNYAYVIQDCFDQIKRKLIELDQRLKALENK